MRPTPSVAPIDPSAPADHIRPGAYLQLFLATLGFGVNFWAWALISPLGPTYKADLALTPFQQSLVVAIPVLVGSLGRIPVGGLADRFGARVMFPAVSFLTALPVLFVGFYGTSLTRLVLGGFFLGLGGTAFAIGVPFVNSWFPPERRGLAIGIFGVGMGGTAISAFTTVKLVEAHSLSFPFTLVACVLIGYGVIAWLFIRESPAHTVATGAFWARTWTTMKIKATLQLSFLYAVGFGGFVAFSVYLPTYLQTWYGLEKADAASRTAGFVVLAIVARPIGGWLSDRFHPVPVLVGCFSALAVLALVVSVHIDLVPYPTIAFLAMAAVLGAAAGAVFALVAQVAPADKVGSVTGVVGAAGGLGGFIPPLIMGVVYSVTGNYSLGYILLALVASGAALYAWTAMRTEGR